MKKILLASGLLAALFGCATYGGGNGGVGAGWTGASWHHPSKAGQEAQMDYYDCKSRSAPVQECEEWGQVFNLDIS